jgi:hypothetical protein
MARKDMPLWASALVITLLLVGSLAAVWTAVAIQGAGLLLILLALFGALAALWFAAGRPPVWGGERAEDEHRWWRGGAASPHH